MKKKKTKKKHRAVSLSYIPTGCPCCNKYKLIMWLKAGRPREDVAIFKKQQITVDEIVILLSAWRKGQGAPSDWRASDAPRQVAAGSAGRMHFFTLSCGACYSFLRSYVLSIQDGQVWICPSHVCPFPLPLCLLAPRGTQWIDCSHPLYHNQRHHLQSKG